MVNKVSLTAETLQHHNEELAKEQRTSTAILAGGLIESQANPWGIENLETCDYLDWGRDVEEW